MTQPALFKQITQVAMVVKDVEATAKRYWDDVGVGPWKFYTIDPRNTGSMMLRGKPVEHAFRAAIATIGDTQLELIEPLDENSLYAEHLAAHGEGLHHIAVSVESFDAARSHLKSKGYSETQSGRTFNIANYCYFDTDKHLGCITEYGLRDDGESFPEPDFEFPNET